MRRRVIAPILSGVGRSLPSVPDDTVTAPRPRFQRLRDRLAGRPADTTLRRDIPEPLAPVLRHWIKLASQYDPDAPQRGRAAPRAPAGPRRPRASSPSLTHSRTSPPTPTYSTSSTPSLPCTALRTGPASGMGCRSPATESGSQRSPRTTPASSPT